METEIQRLSRRKKRFENNGEEEERDLKREGIATSYFRRKERKAYFERTHRDTSS